MITVAAIVTVALASALNAARGGRYPAISRLPGHTRLWASLGMFLLASGWLWDLKLGALWGVCFLAWSWLPWGRWFDLGHNGVLPPRDPSWFEKTIEKLSGGDDQLSFFIRNMVGSFPAVFLLSPFMILLAPLQSVAYNVGWLVSKERPITYAEYITGAAWGLLLVMV